MQFSTKLSTLFAAVALVVAVASPTVVKATIVEQRTTSEFAARDSNEITTFIVTEAEMKNWIATTDANLTFFGEPITYDIVPRSAQNTIVTYCSSRVGNVCGGQCSVYNGGATCLNAPDTQCLSATNNVGFCNTSGCGGICNQFSTCGVRLENNFCDTPGTESIIVSNA
ncbi:uncharacterized protein STEHIDRAFT_169287 [Stereum hirsutum FP-91666 SS1]|uniref:uncharacterized protein n=1 Tax=Stereum hirsutum (strain FP-91666) TaxID=721885 RepID=UPI00044496CD|nr:uncharacterized protein STEHIDRAFT_169287 [Stereum hirsutum FP-91666 SS1]EIM85312.1 hypothetical protein STEHIDRAFT_169287 [Stereum hirsutum FP-91666 SS1]